MYRVTEKEEIDKYKQLGKTAEDYYEDKIKLAQDAQDQTDDTTSTESIKSRLLKKDQDSGMEVKLIESDSYSQVQVSSLGESPDPRVAGPKIIFDSRLDKF